MSVNCGTLTSQPPCPSTADCCVASKWFGTVSTAKITAPNGGFGVSVTFHTAQPEYSPCLASWNWSLTTLTGAVVSPTAILATSAAGLPGALLMKQSSDCSPSTVCTYITALQPDTSYIFHLGATILGITSCANPTYQITITTGENQNIPTGCSNLPCCAEPYDCCTSVATPAPNDKYLTFFGISQQKKLDFQIWELKGSAAAGEQYNSGFSIPFTPFGTSSSGKYADCLSSIEIKLVSDPQGGSSFKYALDGTQVPAIDSQMTFTYNRLSTTDHKLRLSSAAQPALPTIPVDSLYPAETGEAQNHLLIPAYIQNDPTALASDILPIQGQKYTFLFKATLKSGATCSGGSTTSQCSFGDDDQGSPLKCGSIVPQAKCDPTGALLYPSLTNVMLWQQASEASIFGSLKSTYSGWATDADKFITFSRWYLSFIFYVAGKNVDSGTGASTVLSKVSLLMQGMREQIRGVRWFQGTLAAGGGFSMWGFPGDLAPPAQKPAGYVGLTFAGGAPYTTARPNPNRNNMDGTSTIPGINSPPEDAATGGTGTVGNPPTATYDYDYVPAIEVAPPAAPAPAVPLNMPWVVQYFILPLYYENTGLFTDDGMTLNHPSTWVPRKLTANVRYGWVVDQSTSLPWRTYATQFPFHPMANSSTSNGSNEWLTQTSSAIKVNGNRGGSGGVNDYVNYLGDQCSALPTSTTDPATYYLFRGPPETKAAGGPGSVDHAWDVPYKATYHYSKTNDMTAVKGYIYGDNADPYFDPSVTPGAAATYQEGTALHTPASYRVATTAIAPAPNTTPHAPLLPNTTVNPGNNLYQAFRQMSDIQYYILKTLEVYSPLPPAAWSSPAAGNTVPRGLLQSPFFTQDTEGGGGLFAGEVFVGAGAYFTTTPPGADATPDPDDACSAAGGTAGFAASTQAEVYFPNNYDKAAAVPVAPPPLATQNKCLSTKISDGQVKTLRAGGTNSAPLGNTMGQQISTRDYINAMWNEFSRDNDWNPTLTTQIGTPFPTRALPPATSDTAPLTPPIPELLRGCDWGFVSSNPLHRPVPDKNGMATGVTQWWGPRSGYRERYNVTEGQALHQKTPSGGTANCQCPPVAGPKCAVSPGCLAKGGPCWPTQIGGGTSPDQSSGLQPDGYNPGAGCPQCTTCDVFLGQTQNLMNDGIGFPWDVNPNPGLDPDCPPPNQNTKCPVCTAVSCDACQGAAFKHTGSCSRYPIWGSYVGDNSLWPSSAAWTRCFRYSLTNAGCAPRQKIPKSIITLSGIQSKHQMFSIEHHNLDCLNSLINPGGTPGKASACGIGDFLASFPCTENALFLLAYAAKADGGVPACSITGGDECCCGDGNNTTTAPGNCGVAEYKSTLPCTAGQPMYQKSGYKGTALYDTAFLPTTWLYQIAQAAIKGKGPDAIPFPPPTPSTTIADAIAWLKKNNP